MTQKLRISHECYHACKTGGGHIPDTTPGQIISPRRYQAALSASEPAPVTHEHVHVWPRTLAGAITEGVGVATVTNTSQPLRGLSEAPPVLT